MIARFLSLALVLVAAGCGSPEPPIERLAEKDRPTNFVKGVIDIAPGLAGKVEPGDALSIFLLDPKAPGRPVASTTVERFALPYKFTLTDKNIKAGTPLELRARLGKGGGSGGGVAAGDIEGACAANPVKPGSMGLKVTLDTVATEEAAASAAQGQPANFVEGVIDIAPELADKVAPGDALFVFLRSPKMPGPPLAMVKVDQVSLPYKFRLSDKNVMFDNMKFEPPMTLHARLSKSGRPVGAPGDIEGDCPSNPVGPGSTGLKVTLDTVVKEKRASTMDDRAPAIPGLDG